MQFRDGVLLRGLIGYLAAVVSTCLSMLAFEYATRPVFVAAVRAEGVFISSGRGISWSGLLSETGEVLMYGAILAGMFAPIFIVYFAILDLMRVHSFTVNGIAGAAYLYSAKCVLLGLHLRVPTTVVLIFLSQTLVPGFVGGLTVWFVDKRFFSREVVSL